MRAEGELRAHDRSARLALAARIAEHERMCRPCGPGLHAGTMARAEARAGVDAGAGTAPDEVQGAMPGNGTGDAGAHARLGAHMAAGAHPGCRPCPVEPAHLGAGAHAGVRPGGPNGTAPPPRESGAGAGLHLALGHCKHPPCPAHGPGGLGTRAGAGARPHPTGPTSTHQPGNGTVAYPGGSPGHPPCGPGPQPPCHSQNHTMQRRCHAARNPHDGEHKARLAVHAIVQAVAAHESRLVRLDARVAEAEARIAAGGLSEAEQQRVGHEIERLSHLQERLVEELDHLQQRLERLQAFELAREHLEDAVAGEPAGDVQEQGEGAEA